MIIKWEGIVYLVDPCNTRLILVFLRTDKEEMLPYTFANGSMALQP
jgi:hypothetical protein